MNANTDGARLVSRTITDMDFKAVIVANKRYTIFPPTIHKLAGAALALDHVANANSLLDIITSQKSITSAARALSWLIDDSDRLTEQLSKGTIEEVLGALGEAYLMVDPAPFLTLSALGKNEAMRMANMKQ